MTGQSRRSGPDVHMNHFTLGEWADFVWRLQDPSVTAQMQQHLDESCRKCSRIVRMWHHLFDFGSKEGLYCPPDRALRSVRGYYGLLRPGRRGSRVAAMARLVFDSFGTYTGRYTFVAIFAAAVGLCGGRRFDRFAT